MRAFRECTAPQGTPEWLADRAGKVTASRAADLLATIRSGEAAARRNYRVQLVAEILTQQPAEDGFVSAAMQRGKDLEPQARTAYELLTGQLVREVGFIARTDIPIGCSPDGVIGDFEGLLELNVPLPATHLGFLKAGVAPADYVPQITHQLLVTDAAYVDFLSYAPAFPEHLQTFLIRVRREDVDLTAYDRALRAFLREVEQEVESLRTMANPAAQFKAALQVA